MSRKSICEAYLAPLALAAFVVTIAWLSGDPAETIFRKALAAPLFLLAGKGLRSFFPEELDDGRSLPAAAEFHFLNAAIVAAFLVMVVDQGQDLRNHLTTFLVVTLGAGSANLLLERMRKAKSKGRAEHGSDLTDL